MLYLRDKELKLKECNVFDLHKYFFITELVMLGNTGGYYDFTNYDVIIFNEHQEVMSKKVIQQELVAQLKQIDTSVMFKTNYRIFNNDDTNSVFFKAYFVAIAIKYAESNNMSLSDVITLFASKQNKDENRITGLIYDAYMQAEFVEQVVEYMNNYKQHLQLI